jgi:hypothetical protein
MVSVNGATSRFLEGGWTQFLGRACASPVNPLKKQQSRLANRFRGRSLSAAGFGALVRLFAQTQVPAR